MRYFIDANIFLEVELQDKRKEECEKFLAKVAARLEDGVISNFILYSILIELIYRSTIVAAKNFLSFLEQAGIEVFAPDMKTLFDALKIMKNYNLDLDDALVVSSMTASKIRKLVSFDKDFDRVKEIERIEPRDIINR